MEVVSKQMDPNLDNPIFVFYVDVNGRSRKSAQESLKILSEAYRFDNITFWIVPTSGTTKIECIWQGKYNKSLLDEIKELLVDIDEVSDFKQKIREILLGKITE